MENDLLKQIDNFYKLSVKLDITSPGGYHDPTEMDEDIPEPPTSKVDLNPKRKRESYAELLHKLTLFIRRKYLIVKNKLDRQLNPATHFILDQSIELMMTIDSLISENEAEGQESITSYFHRLNKTYYRLLKARIHFPEFMEYVNEIQYFMGALRTRAQIIEGEPNF